MIENNEDFIPALGQKSTKNKSPHAISSFIIGLVNTILFIFTSVFSVYLSNKLDLSGLSLSNADTPLLLIVNFLRCILFLFSFIIIPAAGVVLGIIGLKSPKRLFSIFGLILSSLPLLLIFFSIILLTVIMVLG